MTTPEQAAPRGDCAACCDKGCCPCADHAERLKAAILDIDAHATGMGEDEHGFVTKGYIVTVGALHRALGIIGHTAPLCRLCDPSQHGCLTHEALLITVLQRIRAGWLPHRVGDTPNDWWYGRPSADDGFRLWSEGLVPTMSVVEPMPWAEAKAWHDSLHPYATERDSNPEVAPAKSGSSQAQ